MRFLLNTLRLVLFLFCFSTEAFLLQGHLQHQNASEEQNILKILTRYLPSLTTHSDVIMHEICRAYPSLIIPHPGECQLYYNCSKTYSPVPSYLEQHMMECSYPDLFSEKTLRCENFTDVCCGARKETKNKCLYKTEKAKEQYCNFPSCVGNSDGNISTGWYSYKTCFKERLLGVGSCGSYGQAEELLYKGKCTNRLEIPITEGIGGLLPSCKQKPDGIYQFSHRSSIMNWGDYFGIGRACDAYYICDRENITVVMCPNGTVFHADVGDCRPGNSSLPDTCQVYCNPYAELKFQIGCFPTRVAECPYPLQFSERTKQCENFTQVYCGSRQEIKDYCSYWYTAFLNRHMGNCGNGNHPSNCLHLPNGVFKHPFSYSQKEFIRCYLNRLVEEGQCPVDHLWGTQTYPYNGTCTQKFAIPSSDPRGVGLLPICTGRPDGSYQFSIRPCDAYYRCDSGNAKAIKCPDHTYFNRNSGRCSSTAACYRV